MPEAEAEEVGAEAEAAAVVTGTGAIAAVGALPDAEPGFMAFGRNNGGGEDSDDDDVFKTDTRQLGELCKAPPLNSRKQAYNTWSCLVGKIGNHSTTTSDEVDV